MLKNKNKTAEYTQICQIEYITRFACEYVLKNISHIKNKTRTD